MNFIVMGLGFVVNFSLGLGREIRGFGGFWLWGWAFPFGVFQELWRDAASGCELGPEVSQGADLSFLPSSRGSGRSATWCCGRLCARPRTPLRCNSALRSNLPAFPASARCCSAVPRSPAAPEFAKGAISFLPCRCGLGGDHCPARADSSSCL